MFYLVSTYAPTTATTVFVELTFNGKRLPAEMADKIVKALGATNPRSKWSGISDILRMEVPKTSPAAILDTLEQVIGTRATNG